MATKFAPCIIVRSRAGKYARKDMIKIQKIAEEGFEMLIAGESAKTVAINSVRKLRIRTKSSCEFQNNDHLAGYRSVILPAYRRAAAIVADAHGEFCAANTSRKTFGGPPNYFATGTLYHSQYGAVSIAGEDNLIRKNALTSAILRSQNNGTICANLKKLACTTDCPLAAILIDRNRVPHIFTTNTDMIWSFVMDGRIKTGYEQGVCICGQDFKDDFEETKELPTEDDCDDGYIADLPQDEYARKDS